jgi:predicted metal-dependent phosphoesterase TrpH
MQPPETIKAEFHCHSCYSKDSLVTLQALQLTCQKKAIQRLVITDHNNIQGAISAHELDAKLFISGEEIMTQQGELLGIFVKELIPAGLPALKAIELLRSQDAFISVSHPFDSLRQGHWEEADLLEILPGIDAIEVFNSRCLNPQSNTLADNFAIKHHLLGTVGSDSHSTGEVGTSTLTLPDFHDTASLRAALAQSQAHVRLSNPLVHFHSRYAKWRKQARRKTL